MKGQLTGIAASSFTSVSIDPPLVSFSIATSSSTWPLLREADHLGISVLADHHDAVCRQLAGPREERFAGLPFKVTGNGAVLLDEAVATYDCSVHEEVVAGDHVIVLLEVHEVGGGDGEHPLVFHRSAFAKLHRDDLDPARLDGRINGAEVDRGEPRRPTPRRRARTPHEPGGPPWVHLWGVGVFAADGMLGGAGWPSTSRRADIARGPGVGHACDRSHSGGMSARYAAGVRTPAAPATAYDEPDRQPEHEGHHGEGQQRAEDRRERGERAPSAFIPPLSPATKPAGSSSSFFSSPSWLGGDVDGDGRQRGLVLEPRLLRLQRVELGLAAGELRLDPDDVLEGLRLREQQLDALEARLLRPHADVVVDDLRGDVLGAAVGRAQHARLLERRHRRAELRARHPDHQPGVRRVALVVGLGALLGHVTALRVDDPLDLAAGSRATSLLDSETVPVEMIARSICGVAAAPDAEPDAGAARRELAGSPCLGSPSARCLAARRPPAAVGGLSRPTSASAVGAVVAAVVGGAGGQQDRHGDRGEDAGGAGASGHARPTPADRSDPPVPAVTEL